MWRARWEASNRSLSEMSEEVSVSVCIEESHIPCILLAAEDTAG